MRRPILDDPTYHTAAPSRSLSAIARVPLPVAREPVISRVVRSLCGSLTFAAGVVALLIWTLLFLPVWVWMVARGIIMFSASIVCAVFSTNSRPDPSAFQAIVGLWPRGVATILDIMWNRDAGALPHLHEPLEFGRLLRETAVAVAAYSFLIIVYGYGHHVVAAAALVAGAFGQ